jgi:hypothetical protein
VGEWGCFVYEALNLKGGHHFLSYRGVLELHIPWEALVVRGVAFALDQGEEVVATSRGDVKAVFRNVVSRHGDLGIGYFF